MNRLMGEQLYSQHGEDGMVLELLGQMDPEIPRVCAEIGASDGLELSNTAALWRERDWRAVLCEPKPEHAAPLADATRGYDCSLILEPATTANINAIVPKDCSVLSVDVDGDDYYLLDALRVWPRIIIVEYNPTIPYWLDIVGEPGGIYGASVYALIRLARARGHHLVGATPCNLIFVSDARIASSYETDLALLVGTKDLTYLTTDYHGHMRPVGPLCFGLVSDDS